MKNLESTLISQYATSPTAAYQFSFPHSFPAKLGVQYTNFRLLGLIYNLNDYLDPSADIDSFYAYVWDISTAQGFGLDIWGKILGVNRVLNISAGSHFGFTGPAGRTNASGDSFGGGPTNPASAPFYSGQATTTNYSLTDVAYRTLLLSKAAYNITDGSIPAINQILIDLFITPVIGRTGNAYVTDGGDMTMTYTFDITPQLTSVEYSIVNQSGILPRPCGVDATVVQL